MELDISIFFPISIAFLSADSNNIFILFFPFFNSFEISNLCLTNLFWPFPISFSFIYIVINVSASVISNIDFVPSILLYSNSFSIIQSVLPTHKHSCSLYPIYGSFIIFSFNNE